MPRDWISSLVLVRWVLALLLICGCASPSPPRTEPSHDSMDGPIGVDLGGRATVYPGTLDFMNRYISNVIVLVGPGDDPGACSGVLMAPDKVLTAAHCLCMGRQVTEPDRSTIEARLDAAYRPNGRSEQAKRQKEAWKKGLVSQAQALMDGSNCQRQARVLIINYVAKTKSYIPSEYNVTAVSPHPRFLSLEGSQGDGLFREADLAIIRLSRAVTEDFQPIHLPNKEVYQGQRITLVGYGLGETEYPLTAFGFRHFGGSQITKIDRLASGSTRFATAAQDSGGRELSRNYEGDSGGGGFSQEDDTVLVGIISARLDKQGAVFESVYPHQQWLNTFQN